MLSTGVVKVNFKIIWTWQSTLPAPEPSVQLQWTPWKGKSCQVPALLHPKRLSGRSFPFSLSLSLSLSFFLHIFQLCCKTFLLILFYCYFRGMMTSPAVPKHSTVAQTDSGLSQAPKGCSGPSSSFVR